jgi:beta-1,2-mannobiose phosphorylase / 1,2-beta-oligomannan phosphorylase
MEQVSVVDIARRFKENPLLTLKDIKPSTTGMVVKSLLNPAVFRFDKKTWLLLRIVETPEQKEGYVSVAKYDESGEIEMLEFDKTDPLLDLSDAAVIRYDDNKYLSTISHLRLMCSEDGADFYQPEHYHPIVGEHELEAYGVEDARVAEINGIYHLTYTMVSQLGVGVGLVHTRDWKRFDRRGMILPPHSKDCAIFEEKIRDKYYALHRPGCLDMGGNNIWITESPDGIHWGKHQCIATTRQGMWDSALIGAGCSPIQTPHGWLAIYHGVDDDGRCCLGGLLLDIKDPSRVTARSESPFMEPSELYELNGLSANVILSNGHLVIGDKLRLYYSANNDAICGAEVSIHEILSSLTVVKK